MLRPFGVGVVEPGNLGLDVPKHEGVDFSSNVIPIKVDAQVICARPKMRDGVVRGQDAHEVFGMLLADIFDAKIVDAKGERDGSLLVHPKTWSEFGLCVAFVVEPFFKQLMCQDSCLWQALHALLDLKIDISVRGYFALQFVMFDHVVC